MLRVGLTGGYATGKTFVAHEFARLGCVLIYADELGHEVLLPGGAAYRRVVEHFGSAILDHHGRIDRRALGAVVFEAPGELEFLTGIVHPAVQQLEEKRIAQVSDPRAIVITEAAILIETGRYRDFDKLVLTACEPEQQMARGMRREGATRAEVEARIARQWPFEKKKNFADYIVDTSGTKEDTVRQVEKIYSDLNNLVA